MIRYLLAAYLFVVMFALYITIPAVAHDYMYPAKVVRIIDGDTIVVDINLGMKHVILKEQIRLYGINTPEMNTMEGKYVKKLVVQMIPPGTDIILETIKDKRGKYGRILGIIYLTQSVPLLNIPNHTQLNLWLLNNDHAKEFMAETKDLINRGKK